MATRTPIRTTPSTGRRIGPSQLLTLLSGIVLLAIGIAGFIETGVEDFAEHSSGHEILGFEVNPLHNLVHVVLGVLGLVAWVRLTPTLFYGILVAVGYGAAAIFGIFAIGEDWNFLSLNEADNWLHLGLALLGALIAFMALAEMRYRIRREPEIDLREHLETTMLPGDASRTPVR